MGQRLASLPELLLLDFPRENFGLKPLRSIFTTIALLVSANAVFAQGFVNLNFDNAATMTLNWIANQLKMGTAGALANLLRKTK